ncbi:branched-chain amino acid ABC transporter permease [Herbiconiux sp. P16]|uniref:branched-chain amino acid ABC transporter permease n=1 Tax=Herbiconiux wuyangfengii TaxID=3342794 RepID=UPI0035B9FD14
MTYLAELLINGVSLGLVYSLIALGFVVIYKSTRVINFAQGSTLLLGAYVVAITYEAIGFFPALALGIVAGGAVAAAIEFLLVRRAKRADPTALSILTIGVDVLLATDLSRRIGQQILAFGDPWGNASVSLGSIVVPQARIAAMVISAVLVLAFLLAFKYTTWGVATRATAEDKETASLMGIRLGRISIAAWIIAGCLATVAGVFLGLAPSPGLTNTSNLMALAAIPAAVVGGLDSTVGAVVGGLLIGVVQSLAAGYNDELLFLGQPLATVSAYIVMLIVLLWRPSGLFGSKEISRV